jgi:hypothetical protein
MKKLIIFIILAVTAGYTLSQNQNEIKLKSQKEPATNWSLNLLFSDNGFGIGGAKHFQVSKDISFFTGIFFSGAKDSREFEQSDIWGNSITPFKENRLFLVPVINLGMQFRMFREDVSDNMRPYFNFGIAPTAIVYTPYVKSFFSSFKYARAKYTVGGFAGIGVDYLTNKTSALSFNIRYYYIGLFGDGVRSISINEKKQFGGVYFVFSYNFLKMK